jgi:hypothetical protein
VYQILAHAVEQRAKSRGSGVLFRAGARYLIVPHCVNTGSGPHWRPTEWVPRLVSTRVKRPGREGGHSQLKRAQGN